MVIVMRADLPRESPELAAVISLAESFPGVSTQVHVIQGATRSLTEVYLLGPTHAVPTAPFEKFECVEKVVRITEKYRAIGRHGGLEAVGFEYNGVTLSQDTLPLFPGVCAVDTPKNVDAPFRAPASHGLKTARAGAYQPRTSPDPF